MQRTSKSIRTYFSICCDSFCLVGFSCDFAAFPSIPSKHFHCIYESIAYLVLVKYICSIKYLVLLLLHAALDIFTKIPSITDSSKVLEYTNSAVFVLEPEQPSTTRALKFAFLCSCY